MLRLDAHCADEDHLVEELRRHGRVFCITNPARGKPVKFPYKDTMRAPIHVDEIAEIFARVVMKDKPAHAIYNTGGHTRFFLRPRS